MVHASLQVLLLLVWWIRLSNECPERRVQTGAPSPGSWEHLSGSLEGSGGCLWVVCPSHEALYAKRSLSVNREKKYQ